MASIFKRADRPNGKWYISYCPVPNVHKTVAGCKDKRATEQLANKLETEAFNRSKGIIDATAEKLAAGEARPIGQHLDDFEKVMQGRGRCEIHVHTTRRLIQDVLDGCEFKTAAAFDAARVSVFVADLKARGKSARTINANLTAIKSFSRWLFQNGRMRTDPMPLVGKLNEKADRKHRRRPLADDELAALLEAASAGAVSYDMAGPDRAMLYLLAVETGLRSGELRSLTPESFSLQDLDDGTVTVAAAYSKHRRDDTLPLRLDAAKALAAWLNGKPAVQPVFAMPAPCEVVLMFRADLAVARAAWLKQAEADPKERERRSKSKTLEPVDESGRVLDFHCLRHTFITRLAKSGVHPKTAQALARHSTITLTMDHYTHSLRTDERAALDGLPAVTVKPQQQPEQQAMRATGTDNARADGQQNGSRLAVSSTPGDAPMCTPMHNGHPKADSDGQIISLAASTSNHGDAQACTAVHSADSQGPAQSENPCVGGSNPPLASTYAVRTYNPCGVFLAPPWAPLSPSCHGDASCYRSFAASRS